MFRLQNWIPDASPLGLFPVNQVNPDETCLKGHFKLRNLSLILGEPGLLGNTTSDQPCVHKGRPIVEQSTPEMQSNR